MGGSSSVFHSYSNEYTIGGRNLIVHLDGGKPVLKRTVRCGSRFEVLLEFTIHDYFTDEVLSNVPKSIENYFSSREFGKDIDKNITYRMPGATREYMLSVTQTVIDLCFWKKTEAKTYMRRVGGITAAVFEMEITSNGEFPWTDVVAYLASCMAWSIKSSTIPVNNKCKNCPILRVKTIRFRVPK